MAIYCRAEKKIISVNSDLTFFISRIRQKSEIRFFASVSFLFILRAAEFTIDYLKGDGDGSMTSPIGIALNLVYLVLIGFVCYNFSAVKKILNSKKIIFFVIALSTLISVTTLQKGHDWGDDFSLYIAQAKVICEGGFELLKTQQQFTQSNSGYLLGPDFYPWGYPALIAPAYKFFGLNLAALKVVTYAWFPLLLCLLYSYFNSELKEKTFLFISLFAFSPVIFSFRNSIVGDIPFLFFSMLSVIMIRKIVSQQKFIVNETFSYALLGIVIALTYSIKTQGIVLLPALLATQFIEALSKNELKKSLSIKTFLPYLLFGVLVIIYSKVTGYSDASYASHLDWTNLYYHLQFNFFYYLNLPAAFFDVPVLSNFSLVFWGICFVFVLLGLVDLKIRDTSLLFYVLFTMAILLIAPYQAGIRYIFPTLPVIIYFLLKGLSVFEKRFSAENASDILMIPVIVFFTYGMVLNASDALLHRTEIIEGAFDKEGEELVDFINHNTQPNDVIVFYKPRLLRLLTGRNGFVVKTTSEIKNGRADYIIIHRNAANDLFPANEEIAILFADEDMVFKNSDFSVFRIKRN